MKSKNSRDIAVVERPILMSGPMVRATRRKDKPKTQTRRVMKPQPWNIDPVEREYGRWLCSDGKRDYEITCPYGVVGDHLWVRETWQTWMVPEADYSKQNLKCFYRADGEHQFVFARNEYDGIRSFYTDGFAFGDEWVPENRWRPSIHMLRSRSRVNLEIVGVRVERVQDISKEDAIAEGMTGYEEKPTPAHIIGGPPTTRYARLPQIQYRDLWNDLNEKRGYGWDKNPWVWVVEFKELEGAGFEPSKKE